MTTDNILLQGVVGSTAYGLAGPDSDRDHLGIFLAPLDAVLGLHGPQAVQASAVSSNPDSTLHEIGKYVSLALKCNPTVLELLWLPSYLIETDAGTALIAQRQYFLSEKYVRAAYGGYAKQQADRLMNRHKEGKEGFSSDIRKRTEKHGRHCMRLMVQGMELLQHGEMTVNVSEHRDFLFEMGELAATNPELFYRCFEEILDEFDNRETKLPQSPYPELINDFLIKTRRWYS
jgi:predicted nucleotidyltransferase